MAFWDFLKKKELAQIEELKAHIAELHKYEQVVDAAAEAKKIVNEANQEAADIIAKAKQQEQTLLATIEQLKADKTTLESQYKQGLETYNQLQKEIDIFKDTLDIADYGVYEPHFHFDSSEQYKQRILQVREQQKAMIKKQEAALGGETISWNGSLSDGQKIVKQEKKIMLRAFNGECDSFIANVDWNNVARMEERIQKSYDAINKAHAIEGLHITEQYKNLKIKELRLAFEYKNKKHEEKEEQRQIREQMREEEKAQREIEAAIIKAQKEEEAYQKALEKARKEVEAAQGAQHEKLQNRIAELEARVAEAEKNKERAMSMAQQTRRGHVYIISNIGSFGENVYKIGMTRRLDPMDRVRELGDASVPFKFDVHAIIFSEDAPKLENILHKQFDSNRLNLINKRREFFRVTLSEIEKVVKENHGDIEFTQIAEAQEYRESEVLRNKQTHDDTVTAVPEMQFPNQLFAV